MSSITIILAVASCVVIGLQALVAVAYRWHFGRWLRPEVSPVPALRSNVAAFQFMVAAAVVICSLAFVAAPVVAPDSGFAAWLREPYATIVYIASCYSAMLTLVWLFGIATYVLKEGMRNGK